MVCRQLTEYLPAYLGVCADCVLGRSAKARPHLQAAHRASRSQYDLPLEPPRDAPGVPCTLCGNECVIGEGQRGYCGLRRVQHGKLVHLAGTASRGLLQWYRDPLPTNCVADWVCEGSRKPGLLFSDLGCTEPSHAQEAESAARACGLRNARVGNVHLLGRL